MPIEGASGDSAAVGDGLYGGARVSALFQNIARLMKQTFARAMHRRARRRRFQLLRRLIAAPATAIHLAAPRIGPENAVASSAASSVRWKWPIRLSKRPYSKKSFAPLLSPC